MFIATDRDIKDQDVKFDFFGVYLITCLKHVHELVAITPAKTENFEERKNIAEKLL